MAQQLKDILKQAHDRIKGVHASQTAAGSTGKDPAVDYAPKAGDEQELIAKHSVEKWDEPYGNKNAADGVKYALDTAQNSRMGNDQKTAENNYFRPVKESASPKKAEDTQCNMTKEGVACPVHGMAECWSMKPIREKTVDEASRLDIMKTTAKKSAAAAGVTTTPTKKDFSKLPIKRQDAINNMLRRGHSTSDAYHKTRHMGEEAEQIDELSDALKKRYIKKADKQAKKASNVIFGDTPDGKRYTKAANLYHKRLAGIKKAKATMKNEEVEQVDEKLTKSMSAGDVIHDFVHSDNPKFKGKSTKERQRMALGAYYAMHKEKSKKANEEVDIDEGTMPIKSGNIAHGYHGNVKADGDEDRAKKYASMHKKVKKLAGTAGHLKDARHPNKMVKHFLDSQHGRHVADNPTDKNITSRFGHFKKNYDPKMHEAVQPLLGGADLPKHRTDDTQEEIAMVKGELKAIANKTMHLLASLPTDAHIEPWVQAKVAQAKELINSVHDYMVYNDKQPEDEGTMDTPMTFPNMNVDVNTGVNV